MKTQNINYIKIDKENINYLYGTMVTEGKLILIENKKHPNLFPTTIIISETEKIEMDVTQTLNLISGVIFIPNSFTHEGYFDLDGNCYIPEHCKKVIALPENFSPEIIQDIVNGKLKNGDKVFVKCSMKDREEWMGDSVNGEPFMMEDYFIRLNRKNHIELFSKEEGKKRELKNAFRLYFEGIESMKIEPIEPMSVFKLGITDIQFEFKPEVIEMTITLERPGLLIGKGGRTIDGVTEFLSKKDTPVKIKIIESKLWM